MKRQGIVATFCAVLFVTLAFGLSDAHADHHMKGEREGEKMGQHMMDEHMREEHMGSEHMREQAREMQHVRMWQDIDLLVAVLHPTDGHEAAGVVEFHPTDDGIRIEAHIKGLEPNSTHGIHIHEYGDCSESDGTSAGGHYNPQGYEHGLPDQAKRHAGDLGNLTADDDGVAHFEITVDNISLVGPHNPIVGRGVIVHAKPDTGAQPTGEAGARMACGVIGISKHD